MCVFVVVGLWAGCASARLPTPALGAAEAPQMAVAPEAMAGRAPQPSAGAPQAGPSGAMLVSHDAGAKPKTVANKLLIYQANLVLAVFEVAQAVEQVDELARDLGGYLVQRSDHHITVRVPSDSFREALQKVMSFGDVLNQDISVQDVTEQVFDLQARIRNARAVRDRLAELLSKTTNVNEALAVEQELRRIGDELEQLEGQLKRMNELIAFSTITARFQPPPRETVDQVVRLPFPWLNELGLSHLLRF